MGVGVMGFVEDFSYSLQNSSKIQFLPNLESFMWKPKFGNNVSKKILQNPLIGCFPFVNSSFKMGVTVMWFVEHFGLSLLLSPIDSYDLPYHIQSSTSGSGCCGLILGLHRLVLFRLDVPKFRFWPYFQGCAQPSINWILFLFSMFSTRTNLKDHVQGICSFAIKSLLFKRWVFSKNWEDSKE